MARGERRRPGWPKIRQLGLQAFDPERNGRTAGELQQNVAGGRICRIKPYGQQFENLFPGLTVEACRSDAFDPREMQRSTTALMVAPPAPAFLLPGKPIHRHDEPALAWHPVHLAYLQNRVLDMGGQDSQILLVEGKKTEAVVSRHGVFTLGSLSGWV